MGTRLGVRAVLVLVLLVAGCSAQPATGTAASQDTAPNATDVMFLQMGLAQIAEGDRIAAAAQDHTANLRVRVIATDLRAQWKDESGTMQRWLLGWGEPLTASSSAGVHAGHGSVRTLSDADIAELGRRTGADFDRTVINMLLGNLGNDVETSRMESGGGSYPPARKLAETITTLRQAQISELLKLAAAG